MQLALSNSLLSLCLLAVAGMVLLSGLGSGCAAKPRRHTQPQYVDDATITTQVKNALLADQAVQSCSITVETVKGVVQLAGAVNTSVQKSAAEHDAASVRGVETVLNQLVIH